MDVFAQRGYHGLSMWPGRPWSGFQDAAEAGDIRPLLPGTGPARRRGSVAFLDGIESQWLLDPSFDMAVETISYLAGVFVRLSESEHQPIG